GRGARKKTSRAWNRDALIAETAKLLAKGQSLLLLGPSGVGKSTVLLDAVRIVERDHPRSVAEDEELPAEIAKTPRFWRTSAGRLISGMQYLGQWEERCEEVVRELNGIRGVLCLDNLLDLVRTGGQTAGSGLAAFFGSYLERSELQLVIEATPEQLDACRRLLPGFAEHFRIVDVPEFDAYSAREVLGRLAEHAAQQTKVAVGEGVVELVYRLFRRFQPYEAFPGKTGAFLRQTFDEAGRAKLPVLETDRIVERFALQTGVPERFLRDDVLLPWDAVVGEFEKKIIGQSAACRTAADLVATFKAGLNDPHRPLGAYLFCGPTGVGKTELAKTLAAYLFGRADVKESFVRLDMSEYAGFGAAERLIMQPDGQPSRLIKQVRRRPFCVVLLDEVEKAAPEVFDVLLGVFDEGRLTDRFGRTTIFRSAVIIMTSNLGATAKDSLGFDGTTRPSYEREALGFFRPEFINRLDGIVTFAPLAEHDVLKIAAKELDEIGRREGFVKADLKLTWSDALARQMAREGWDARFGARPLQRTLERRVVAPLARWLVENPAIRKRTLRINLDDARNVTIETV
ncbi:MAG TPA: AAA family ATPase, partial [Pirellulales bacterium]